MKNSIYGIKNQNIEFIVFAHYCAGGPGDIFLQMEKIIMLDFYKEARELHEKEKYEEAVELYKQGIEAGDEKCWYGYAILLKEGNGISADSESAMSILREHFDAILALANSGDAAAMRIVGFYYYNGFTVEANEVTALGWFEKSANAGDVGAMVKLGSVYRRANYTTSKAFKWFLKAAELGHIHAQFWVAHMYSHGEGVKQDFPAAFKWYSRAAKQGDVTSQTNLGVCYANGKGADQNMEEAIKWYIKAAKQGYAPAQLYLGFAYRKGEGVHQNWEEATKWISRAALQGLPRAQENLANMYYYGNGVEQNFNEAAQWWIKSAEQGYALAQYNLGVLYYYGEGVDQSFTQAIHWYRKAAEQNESSSQNNLGLMYARGEGIEQDYVQASYWYSKAASHGDSYGFANLGNLYRDGLGVCFSAQKAVELWCKACEAKEDICNFASYNLGYAYYDGWGVERDLNKAKYHFELAIKNGYQCSYALEMVKRELGEEFKDNLMHEYAESIVKKHISNDKLYVRISKDLEKDFGSAWHTMDKESKNFLISGLSTYIIYYSMGAQIYGNLDFSQSIMEMCKALERELGKYLYSGYVEYLKKKKIDPKTFNPKRTFVKKVSASEYDYYSSGDVKKFTLGNLEDTLGIERFMQSMIADDVGIAKSNKYELKIDETMSSYLDCLFKSDAFSSENRKREIQHYIISLCQEVQSIADSFRNPSAHTNIMKYHRAEVCGNYIIKVKKLLKNFIDKIEEIHQ